MATLISDLDPSNPRIGDAPINWKPPQRCKKQLAVGGIIPANDTWGEVVNILGSGRIRVTAKVSAGGTLRLRWRLADMLTSLATPANNPFDPGTALVGGTELSLDIANNPGFAYLEIAVVNGGAPSTISYVDVFQTAYGN